MAGLTPMNEDEKQAEIDAKKDIGMPNEFWKLDQLLYDADEGDELEEDFNAAVDDLMKCLSKEDPEGDYFLDEPNVSEPS